MDAMHACMQCALLQTLQAKLDLQHLPENASGPNQAIRSCLPVDSTQHAVQTTVSVHVMSDPSK